MSFQDHFSGHAVQYAQARPDYPPELFAWLASLPGERELAWDVGCGNGQAALALTDHFERVVATDASAAQVGQAERHRAIDYRVEPAELPTLALHSVDLITVAQALHWFDLEAFYAIARCVLRHDGVIAAWCYGISRVEPTIDVVFDRLYRGLLAPFWPVERKHIENAYADLAFPFRAIAAPGFTLRQQWTLDQYLDYLRSWSASQRHLREKGIDAVDAIQSDMARAWGNPSQVREVVWPLTLKVGRLG